MVRILAEKHLYNTFATMSWKRFFKHFGQVSLQYVSSMSCKTYGKCCYDVLQTIIS